MNATTILSFDRTFEGYLSAVYTAFSEKLEVMDLCPGGDKTTLLFNQVRHIPSNRKKARRVWDALAQKGTADLRLAYFAFLSENEELLFPIFEFISLLFRAGHPESPGKLQALRTKLDSWAQRVEGEKRKMEAILRLQSPHAESPCFRLYPTYDVLPLLTRYCRLHFGSDPWMLIDTKRKYGLCKKAAGIECFPLSDELSGSAEDTSKGYWQEREAGMAQQGVHSLQTAV